MENPILLIIALLVGLLFGGGGALFFASRTAADLKERLASSEGQSRELEVSLGDTKSRLAAVEVRAGQAEALERELGEERTKRMALSERYSQLDATAKEREKAFEEQKRLLSEAREELTNQFKAAGAEVLRENQEAFLRRAEERFRQSEEAGEAKIKALLNPVGERLASYEKQVSELEAKRTDAFGQLHGLIQSMREGQEEVRREAQRLGNSLTNAPKARGRWGERALQNLLEQCGLAEHTDFMMEHSVDTDEGRLRPDAIINVPGQKKLVIDSKVSLNAYQAAFEADDDETRKRELDAHAKSMRNHVQTLGAKSYQSQFEEAPDYVIMFIPGEHFVTAALDADPTLWDFAFERRVLLATPTNLVAIARTVAQVWRQDGLAKEAQEIGRMGAELYGRLETAASHLKRVGGGLETAVNNYNKFVGSFERNVLSSGKRLAEKGVEIGKREIEEVPLVESTPRYNAADAKAVDDEDEGFMLESKQDAAE
ncbi:DNA recombination protein RmuC [Erythrobacter sp. SCSIO 43205]|uniref:DNA recombination protein RmuC n=1 Tax=Erythrobacter sp. SCSIO 43205 TaxID=2779361 RepID=UPI001CA7CAA5|nr:DNA recombination protein RmuC [Erythrobacter sp. SCSIO 43205]UAB79404.1 DNA recombination protein RmuC [Erythrobacter sp. SCSIO 43205]